MASNGMASVSDLRAQLAALETERAMWTAQRTRDSDRLAWIERQQQQQKRLNGDALTTTNTVANGVATTETRDKPSKREEMQELREKTLQLLKTQQQVATQIATQLRTMRASPHKQEEVKTNTAPVRSPSPPQEKPASNHSTPRRGHRSLVLVPTVTTALGKRTLASGAPTTPTISYPPCLRSSEVPSESTEELAAVAFRIATRYYLSTGQILTRAALRSALETCVGRSLREDEMYGIVDETGPAMELVVATPIEPESPRSQAASNRRPDAVVVTATHLDAWLDAEKSTLDELVAAWAAAASSSATRSTRLVAAVRAHQLMRAIGQSSSFSTSTLLTALVGRREVTRVEVDTAFPHLTTRWEEAEAWLRSSQPATTSDLRTATTSDGTLKFDRPFDVENDSVLKQVQRARKRPRRSDPMKVLCVYELSGTCNDPNCAFQHQRDFEDDGKADEPQQPNALRLTDATTAWINQLIQFRDSVRNRWPTIRELLENKHTDKPVPPLTETTAPQQEDQEEREDGTSRIGWNDDFVALGSPLSSPVSDAVDGRNCRDELSTDDSSSKQQSLAALEARVDENREDLDAWLLLALRSLDLEVVSDENVVRVSDSTRLLAELEALCALLHTETTNVPSEDKIELSLHVLSRALEVEANAYSEELWLFHLRLSQRLTTHRNIETELQMTEQALSFVPTSVSLWRHFLTLQASCLDKLDDAVATFIALLGALAAASHQTHRVVTKEAFSVLLCDVVIQLVSLYCNAGNATAASAFMASLFESEESDVRDQMIGDELLTLRLVHVHVALFSTVPLWFQERAFGDSDAIDVYRLLLHRLPPSHSHGVRQALAICRDACACVGTDATRLVPPGLEVLRHNWIIVAAYNPDVSFPDRLAQLVALADEERARVTPVPRLMSTLADLFRRHFERPDLATAVLDDLLNRYKTIDATLRVEQLYHRFGEALHHYLLHQPDLFTADPFHTEFPTLKFVLARLAAIVPTKNPIYAKRALQAIAAMGDWTKQRVALGDLFTTLMRDTLEHVITSACDRNDQDTDAQDLMHDAYYVAAQVQVLHQVCGVSTAIDVMDRVVLKHGRWRHFPVECRRMLWSVRFVLLMDSFREDLDVDRPRALASLLDRYFEDVDAPRDLGDLLATRLGTSDQPAITRAVALAIEGTSSSLSSALDLALFSLATAATLPHERPHLFAMHQHRLGTLHSGFWPRFVEAAVHDSTKRRVRSSLRRVVLRKSRVVDATSLRLLVALELDDKNVAGAAAALGHRLRVNPLDRTALELVSPLEALCGDRSGRNAEMATALEATGGVLLHLRSLFGHDPHVRPPLATSTSLTHIQFARLGLERVSPVLAMHWSNALRVLDLSHNLLVSLPDALCRLPNLRELDIAGNALVALPPLIGLLANLQVLNVSHNQLTEIPNALWDRVVELRHVDIRGNALTGISPRVVHLTKLEKLFVAGNKVTWAALAPIAAKLPTGCIVDIAPTTEKQNLDEREAKSSEPTPSASPDAEHKPTEAAEADADKTVDATDKSRDVEQRETSTAPADTESSQSPEPQPANAPAETGATQSSQPQDTVVSVEDDVSNEEETPKRDDGTDSSTTPSVVDVETTETRSSSTPEKPTSDMEISEDDDEVECLGSSLAAPVATAPVVSRPTAPSLAANAESVISDELVHRVAREIEWHTDYPRCLVCAASNAAGTHQRFNTAILCVRCLTAAVAALQRGPPCDI